MMATPTNGIRIYNHIQSYVGLLFYGFRVLSLPYDLWKSCKSYIFIYINTCLPVFHIILNIEAIKQSGRFCIKSHNFSYFADSLYFLLAAFFSFGQGIRRMEIVVSAVVLL